MTLIYPWCWSSFELVSENRPCEECCATQQQQSDVVCNLQVNIQSIWHKSSSVLAYVLCRALFWQSQLCTKRPPECRTPWPVASSFDEFDAAGAAVHSSHSDRILQREGSASNRSDACTHDQKTPECSPSTRVNSLDNVSWMRIDCSASSCMTLMRILSCV